MAFFKYQQLELKDLFRLNFERGPNGDYVCPISKKKLSQHKQILAIRTTGNVYSKDTVYTLNVKPKFWRDLMTDEPFTRKDIIKILDPEDPDLRTIPKFYYITQEISLDGIIPAPGRADGKKSTLTPPGINANMTTLNTLKELNEKISLNQVPGLSKKLSTSNSKPEPLPKGEKTNSFASYYAVSTSASFTSTALDPIVKGVLVRRSDEEYMFANVRGKACIQISTNFGNLNFELFCREAPKACYNFIRLAKSGYYDNTIFHRLIRKFMIQGGDPTGTGRGGESYWGNPFEDEFSPRLLHSSRGMLSMANRGPKTNTSQFFITFKPCEHLNNKHTVFGTLVGGAPVLREIESIPTDRRDFPKQDIRITTVNVFVNPFDEFLVPQSKKLPGDTLPLSSDTQHKITQAHSSAHSTERPTQRTKRSHENTSGSTKRIHLNFGDFSSW